MTPQADWQVSPESARLRPLVRRAGKAVAGPVLRYFNRRFGDLHTHLEQQDVALANPAIERTLDETRQVYLHAAESVEIVSELTLTLQRFIDRFGERVEDALAAVARSAGATAVMPGSPSADERSLQLAFALGSVLSLPVRARVLVVDDDPVRVASALAGVGLDVTALGPVGPTPAHPAVRIVAEPVATWVGPGEPYDLSLVRADASELDPGVLDRVGAWLTGDGEVLLTVTGDALADTGARLEDALPSWKVSERRAYVRRDPATWVPAPEGVAPGALLARLTRQA